MPLPCNSTIYRDHHVSRSGSMSLPCNSIIYRDQYVSRSGSMPLPWNSTIYRAQHVSRSGQCPYHATQPKISSSKSPRLFTSFCRRTWLKWTCLNCVWCSHTSQHSNGHTSINLHIQGIMQWIHTCRTSHMQSMVWMPLMHNVLFLLRMFDQNKVSVKNLFHKTWVQGLIKIWFSLIDKVLLRCK
jgi:hypothetical protein